MRSFRKIAVTVATVGLAAFGAVAGGGAASAATNQAMTGCDLGSSELTANVAPTCTASTSTVLNPTSVTVTVSPAFFSALGGLGALLGQTLAASVTYTLSCSVNGGTQTYNGSFTATSSAQSQTVSLQTAVGAPEANSCTMSSLKATSAVTLNSTILGALGDNTLSFGVSATADTAVPGSIWMESGKTSAGVNADICVDDAANGNANAIVQVYQCSSDLAQYWVWTSGDQIVHNGDCLDLSGSKVILAACSDATSQKWQVNGINGNFNTIVNQSSNQCLTASKPTNATQLTVATCTSAANQKWAGPGKSPA
jgi:Ricin-type beta-trefoil lectin domain